VTVTYSIDVAHCSDWDTRSEATQQTATRLAWRSLRHLTGGRVGNPPVVIRPCRATCAGWTATPTVSGGSWYNVSCGHSGANDCGCYTISAIDMPGRVAEIVSVVLNGVTLNPESYVLVNGSILWRREGEWPLCQDLSQPSDGDSAFAVTYIPGVVPGVDGQYAAGALACEFAKAIEGGKCRLPSSVTSLVRQGVTMEFTQGIFPGGITGIREVDVYVKTINPHSVSQPSRVWSPDTVKPAFHA